MVGDFLVPFSGPPTEIKMSHQITFRSGEPHTFISTRSFTLGDPGVSLPKGAQLKFDGTVCEYGGLAPLNMPQLRGAIRTGWLVLESEYDPDAPEARPQSAGVQMRKADGGNPMDRKERSTVTTATVEDEEREVGTVAGHRDATAERNKVNYRRGAENTAMAAGSVVVEPQDGIPVRELRTPAKMAGTDVTMARSAIAQTEAAAAISPGKGRTREEMMAEMDPEQRAEYAVGVASRKAAYDPEGAAQIVASVESGPAEQVKDGIKSTMKVGGGTAIHDAGGTGATAETEIVVEEGVTFTRTKAKPKVAQPPPVAVDVDEDQARTIARSICPNFPENYVFSDPVRKKIARLQADYDDQPEVIKAVAAADTDPEVRKRLLEEFPGAFA